MIGFCYMCGTVIEVQKENEWKECLLCQSKSTLFYLSREKTDCEQAHETKIKGIDKKIERLNKFINGEGAVDE